METKYISAAHDLATLRAAINAAIELTGGDAKIELKDREGIIIWYEGQRYAIDISVRA